MKQSLIKYPNGLKVVVCSRVSNVVTISVSVCCGAEQEKKDKAGITKLIEMLISSSIKKSQVDLSTIVESRTDYEHFEITLSTIRENLKNAFRVLSRAVFDFSPTYKEFQSAKSGLLQLIEKAKANPFVALNGITQKTRYKGTSLATEVLGTTKSVQDLTIEVVRDYYYSILTPENILFSVVGNIGDEIVSSQINAESTAIIAKQARPNAVSREWGDVKPVDGENVIAPKYNADSINFIKDLITKEFYKETIPLKKGGKRKSTSYFPLKSPGVIEKYKSLNQSRIQISFPSAPYSSTGYKYSKLFEIMLRNYLVKNFAGAEGVYSQDVSVHQFKNNAYLTITYAVDYEKATSSYNKIIKLLEEFNAQGISRNMFEDLKMAYQTILSLHHEKMSDLAKRFNKWLFLKDEIFNLPAELKMVGLLNYEDYIKVTHKILDTSGMLVVYIGKKLEEELKIKRW